MSRSHCHKSACHKSAFTLIELSIVLVIIGLIIGGVLVGRDLIQAAKIRAVITEREQFETAVMTFKLKYNALPGDMTNATSFWGLSSRGLAGSASTDSPEAATRNGDGNSKITPIGAAPIWQNSETGAAWQQLANAGYISGMYNGANGNPGGTLAISVDTPTNMSSPHDYASPKSKLSPDVWWGMKYMGSGMLSFPASAGIAEGHILLLRSLTSCGSSNGMGSEVLTVAEMQSLDKKIDDGMPITGKVFVPNSNALQSGTGCYYGQGVACIFADATNWNYNMPVGANYKSCMPVFRMGF